AGATRPPRSTHGPAPGRGGRLPRSDAVRSGGAARSSPAPVPGRGSPSMATRGHAGVAWPEPGGRPAVDRRQPRPRRPRPPPERSPSPLPSTAPITNRRTLTRQPRLPINQRTVSGSPQESDSDGFDGVGNHAYGHGGGDPPVSGESSPAPATLLRSAHRARSFRTKTAPLQRTTLSSIRACGDPSFSCPSTSAAKEVGATPQVADRGGDWRAFRTPAGERSPAGR